ncbi:hypothetical protein [Haloarchaeobius amylolyticus]|uniref:hypothetical protein n=1 Tax=Haloarchaeobius amylolyticus TaxID=1198296 RepID=UPI00227156A9|nr:hypothetical protein [Haloarchaeobius amylolyticus]
MHRGVGVLAVALLLATAGCGSLVEAPDATTREPFAVEETVRDGPQSGPEVVPGLTWRAVTDAEALAESHRSVVAGESRVLRREHVVRTDDGSVRARAVGVLRVGEDGQVVYTFRSSGANLGVFGLRATNYSVWTNGSVTVVRVQRATGVAYEVLDGRRRLPADSTGAERVRVLFERATVQNVTTRYWNGDTYYRVEATVAPGDISGFADPDLYRLSANVVNSGAVARLTFRYPFVRGDERFLREQDWSVGAVGSTVVERPDWVATALDGAANRSRPR